MKGSVWHNFHNHPLMMTLHYTCMASMILMVWDPNLATWGTNFIGHMVEGFGNLGPAVQSYTGAFNAAAAPAAVAVPPVVDHSMHMGMP